MNPFRLVISKQWSVISLAARTIGTTSARLCCLLITALLITDYSPAHAAPPNIVMIISDDQLWEDFSLMNHPVIQTPHIDKLASQSLTFPRGYVPSSLCCPSLASIVTGLYPHQHKVTSNDPPIPEGMPRGQFNRSKAFTDGRDIMNKHLEAVPTMPRELVKQGYLALQTGKWWQGHFSHGGFTHGMTKGSRHGDEGLDIGRKTMQPIYDFMDEAKAAQKPFFVWYAPMMPHDPHTPPERLLNKYKDKAPPLHVAKYMAMVEWFDETIGDLMANLDKRGLADNTIVCFVVDNGWITNPTTGRYDAKSKQSQYDGGTRTPIMIRWPGHVKPRRDDTNLAMSIDLMPTLLNTIGQKPTKAMQGVNLLDEKAVKARKAIHGEIFTHNAVDLNKPASSLRWRWMIEGDWKLIVPDATNEPKEIVELYRVTKDIHEETNLADKEPKRVEALRKKLDAWWPGKS